MFKLKKHNRSTGQALVEFAIIAVVLLMIIFIIIEAARILWAWGTVQNAAREGARYAITGQFDPDCATTSLPKFDGDEYCDDLRVASVISQTHRGLAGLPLNETSGTFEDDEYYQIEVWGVNQGGQLQGNFAGMPNMPVIVRAYYRVPIISPFFNAILPSIPVFGQVTMYNESFGQLGGSSSQGAALPPPLPVIPTAGVTPSPTFTPTPDPNTPTFTHTPTNTPTDIPEYCIAFDQPPVAGNNYVYISSEIGSLVKIIDLANNGEEISTAYTVAGPFDGHACPGFIQVFLTKPLVVGTNNIAVEGVNGTNVFGAIASVLPGTPTPTATHTPEWTPTPDWTETPTATPLAATATPTYPYIAALPYCGSPDADGNVQINLIGDNWPTNKDITIYFDGEQGQELVTSISKGHDGGLYFKWVTNRVKTPSDPINPNTYTIRAVANGVQDAEAIYEVPCDGATAVPTTTAEPTTTPKPADLILVGPPQLITTGDIIGYRPVDFSVVITNTGDIDVNKQFFVDLYLDPAGPIAPGAELIPISESDGYAGISSLAGNTSKTVIINAPFGFENKPDIHNVYGMVDSIQKVTELREDNNVSAMATANYVTPGPTPTPSPTPDISGENNILGIVNWISQDGFEPLHRAYVYLYNKSGILVNFTRADADGFYQFLNLPDGTYTVRACGNLDGDRFGARSGIVMPSSLPVYSIYTDPVPCQ